ncbi:MAG: hypothetical protein ACRD0K_15465 [Egibacteraceae bacterium]
MLAAVEARRLLRRPFVAGGAALSMYVYFRGIEWGQVPVLPRDDVEIGYALLPLAAVTLLAANAGAMRSRRHGTQELYDSLPTAPEWRTAGHLLSVIAPFGLAALLAAVDIACLMLLGGIGTPNFFEVATGPAVVALAGVLGVLLARLAPWTGVAPLTLVGFAAMWYFPYLSYHVRNRIFIWPSFWAFPWFGPEGSEADVANPLAGGWHLAYVAGLVVLIACLAMAFHRLRLVTVVAAMLAAALTVGAALTQSGPLTAEELVEMARFASGAPDTQVCEARDLAEYCTWPAYGPLIDRWHRPINGVMERLPAAVAGQGLRVRQMALNLWQLCDNRAACRQQVDAVFKAGIRSSDVRVTSIWPRDSEMGGAELALAASVASWAVGLDTEPQRNEPPICLPSDQARVAVALWLAAQSTPEAAASLRALHEDAPVARSLLSLSPEFDAVRWPRQEVAYAVALLDHPAWEVAARLQRAWARFTDPGMRTAELAAAFELRPPPVIQERAAVC